MAEFNGVATFTDDKRWKWKITPASGGQARAEGTGRTIVEAKARAHAHIDLSESISWSFKIPKDEARELEAYFNARLDHSAHFSRIDDMLKGLGIGKVDRITIFDNG